MKEGGEQVPRSFEPLNKNYIQMGTTYRFFGLLSRWIQLLDPLLALPCIGNGALELKVGGKHDRRLKSDIR